MNTNIRAAIAAVAFAGLSMAVLTSLGHAQGGQTGLSKCYDSVISSCNKKGSDAAINACVNSGLDQCDGQFKASGGSSASETAKLRANAMSKVKAAPAKRP